MGGRYHSGSAANIGSQADYWSSTAYNSTNAYLFTLHSDNVYPQSNYNKDRLYSVRCVARTDDPIGTMQNVSEWADSVQKGKTVRTTDTRDNKEYTVARLEDGKLWMTKNLEIAGSILTPSDSDVSSNYSLPPSSTSGFNDNSAAYVYIDSHYGGYYTWIAATAGTGSSFSSDGQQISSSVCPKGWRLPTKDEFTTLATAYGGNNETSSSALRITPASFTYAGYYYLGSPLNQGSGGYEWSSTSGGNTSAWYFNLSDSSADLTNYSRGLGLSVRCVSRTDDSVMQNVSEWGSSVQADQTVIVTDIRDGKGYTVSRLKDNKLWMTKNLEIENYNLTSADSDVSSSFRIPASTNNPNSNNSYSSKALHVDSTYGGYYTWYTVTVGEGVQSKSSGDVSHSICPKNWRLPTSAEYKALNDALGGKTDASGATALQATPNNFKMGGSYDSGSSGNVGTHAYYWSSTAYNTDYAYILYFYSSLVSPQYSGNKYQLGSVRCVARQ